MPPLVIIHSTLKFAYHCSGVRFDETGSEWFPIRYGRVRGFEGSHYSTWQSTSFLFSKGSVTTQNFNLNGQTLGLHETPRYFFND